MRFYLLYRNHGLYDPVLDDTELVYVPTEEEWQTSNTSEQTHNTNYEQKYETNNENIIKTQAKETLNTVFEDQIKMNSKDAFTPIDTEDLPPQARFKLPISDEYDPEGKKMSKLRKLYEKVLNIDLTKVLEQMRYDNNMTNGEFKEVKQDVINKDVNIEEIRKQNEMIKKDFMYTVENKENFNTTKETAVKFVENRVNKARLAESKQKTRAQIDKEIKHSESEIYKENFESLNQSKLQENETKSNYYKDEHKQDTKHSSRSDKKQTKKVTFNVDEHKEEESFFNETEIEDTSYIETDGRLTPEKRKLLYQQDIEEVIQPGTVRDRLKAFKNTNIINDVVKKSDYKHEKSDLKRVDHVFSKTKHAKKILQQKAYRIGAQTILNVQRACNSSFGKILLKPFFSQFTKLMLILSKYIKIKPESYFTKEENYFEQRREEDSSKVLKEGELIRKKKLSGAKIAQIEGMKPVDLTNKMNVVISELQRISGIEDDINQKEFDKTESNETDFGMMEFDKNEEFSEKYEGCENKTDEDCKESSYQHKTNYNEKQNSFHSYETTKTQTMEIREIRSEKRYSENKSNKKESSPCNEVRTYIRDANGNIIYIAIVEAHVYTYKDAIFQDYMRRMSQSKNIIEMYDINKQSDVKESADKIDIYVGFDDSRKLSLASTIVVPVEEYGTVQEMENTNVNYIKSTKDLEHVAKKVAVQNITQVIEPLLKTEVNVYSDKCARAEIQMPVQTIAEQTEIATEQDQMFFQAQVVLTQKSYISIEKPEKSSVEITEISIDDETAAIDEVKVKEEQSQIVIEPPLKSLARETITTFVEEPQQKNLKVSEIVEKLPQSLVEKCVFTAPETIDFIPEEPKEDEFIVNEIPQVQPNIVLDVVKPITTNIVFLEDQHDELQVPVVDAKIAQPELVRPHHVLAEILTVTPEGTKDGNFEIEKILEEKIKLNFNESRSIETTCVALGDTTTDILPLPKINEQQSQIKTQAAELNVAETLIIIPEEYKDQEFYIETVKNQEARINIKELKAAETKIITSEEIANEKLDLPEIIKREPQTSLVTRPLAVAETLTICSIESATEVDTQMIKEKALKSTVPDVKVTHETHVIIPEEAKNQELKIETVKNQEARINVEEIKAAEIKIITSEEFANEKFDVPEIIKKEPRTSLVTCPLAVAESITTRSIESATEVDTQIIKEKALKSTEQDVKVTLETVTPLAHTSITSIEETVDLSEKLKLSSQSANVRLVESSATTVVDTTPVTVAKEEAFRTYNLQSRVKIREIPMRETQEVKSEDIELNYTVELPKDEEVNEVFAEVTLIKQKSPPVEVFAEYEINENKTDVDSSIYESIKLLKKHIQEFKSTDENYSYTALISDVELEKKVEEELLEILQSSKIEDISHFTFPSPTLIPIIQEYLFRLRGPKLKIFKHVDDVFEEATLRLKTKLQTATVENFDTSLTLILQDIAVSQLHPEVIEVNEESTEYVSEKESSMQYFDSKKVSRSVEASVQSSETQSLHTEVAAARAATKQTIETGIDVSVLSIEEEPIVESRRRISTAQTKKTSMTSTLESMEAESGSDITLDARSQVYDSKTSVEAQSSNASVEISEQAATEISSKHIKSKKTAASSVAAMHTSEKVALERNKSSSINDSNHKLGIRTDLTADESEAVTNGFSPSPPLSPQTPLVDEYIFKFDIPLPRVTRYVERDCSYSPESIEDDIILKCGYIPHIITRIERIIYSPPLPTPPASPERQIIPIYKKPGLKGGWGDYGSSNISLFDYYC